MADDLDVDKVISILIRNQPTSVDFQVTQKEVKLLCKKAIEILMSQPMLLKLEPPVNILGDIHGQFLDLLRLFNLGGFPPDNNYLFMGDYVDRGPQSCETMCLLLSYKVKYPENFFLLRGNHEDLNLNRIFGFLDECLEKLGRKVYKSFLKCFRCLPVAAIVGTKIFAAHGGISPYLMNMEQINSLQRPIDIPTQGLMCDILWSDPSKDVPGWGPNERGVSFTWGEDKVAEFLKKFDLDLLCRAHEVTPDGYEFFAGRQAVTVFSAPNYCDFDNAGAILVVGPDLMCSFLVLKPERKGSIAQKVSETTVVEL